MWRIPVWILTLPFRDCFRIHFRGMDVSRPGHIKKYYWCIKTILWWFLYSRSSRHTMEREKRTRKVIKINVKKSFLFFWILPDALNWWVINQKVIAEINIYILFYIASLIVAFCMVFMLFYLTDKKYCGIIYLWCGLLHFYTLYINICIPIFPGSTQTFQLNLQKIPSHKKFALKMFRIHHIEPSAFHTIETLNV